MNKRMEKISLLALSFMLVSTYSISSVSPFLQDYFHEYTQQQVEQLLSIPSMAVLVMVIASTWVMKVMSERTMIISGLILLSISGVMPMFVLTYPAMLFSRILMGIGIGLVNSRAISMISERFEGEERSKLLGYRTAVEAMGNAVLTFVVGRILLINWKYVFIIYGTGLIILVMYLVFVPKDEVLRSESEEVSKERSEVRSHVTGIQVLTMIFYAFIGCMQVGSNTALTIRIPSLVLERGYATASQASIVLTLLLLIGIVAGGLYGKLMQFSAKYIFTMWMVILCAGMGVIMMADNLIVLGIGALISGFAHNICMTCVFNGLAQHVPVESIQIGTSVILVGCNLGATITPNVLAVAGIFFAGADGGFIVYIAVILILCAVNLALMKVKPEMAVTVR